MKCIIIGTEEMPQDCFDCDVPDNSYWCKYAEIFIDHRTEPGKRYAGCPMTCIPAKKSHDYVSDEYDDGFFSGWNACIDAIMGSSDG